ncbi:3-oxoacyl-[acyl-carrier-protein] synthase II [Saccharopolyspora erythraea NRRL 2338]|uniref:3-oxoacyl-[acyl-carrier-protein] synthase II n=2 Tax=Saccharopolyspora erythraea TaxID=1836 RepID=A4F7C7_SACEN|nr:beta-ketoacyl synthase N-terminal-like domain-containing protein [Saccharopolyspora erythraea]EQD83612.1 3-oxoacyl-ACP synthase [Saccharopolyspora erythraea D]PFG93753.1 3-oxoacyl-[acyl-carrier-protein] synthase II [Saccharopolyspora erythraea NRRL 2338]QRK90590.1 3-oxoacyl-ACP synthase [Saccharopolyspora erythraea]CAL99951.1 3-oxoacyl-[acyl-carrier-protein] synthase II [Saccharopolyspora erythraea NRRL 2338]
MTDVVITGLGLVTPFGPGAGVFWEALRTGRCALAAPARFDLPSEHGEPVGEVPPDAVVGVPRKRAYLAAALSEALESAGSSGLPDDALLVLVGQAPWEPGDDPDWHEFVGPVQPRAARTTYLTHACASAAFGIGFARDAIRAGLTGTAVVAGGSALNRYEYASLQAVRAISRSAARPFDRARSGISIGEGGGAVVLEDASRAAARGAATDVLVAGACRRVGAGKSAASDAGLIEECVREALADARVDRLDHVHAHATGTPQGDQAELAALEAVAAALGHDDLPVSSHKGAIGHLLHVSCLPAVVAAVKALRTGETPPTAGLADPEPTKRLRLAPGRIPVDEPATAAVTSFGFGSNNSTVVLARRPNQPAGHRRAEPIGRPTW